jgi:glycosyltransferase involved in cell wall biosynthesis
MPIIYRMADVFVLPSKGPGETWGLAVNEAMASGRPVIVSNKCGSAIELVEYGINGYTFEAGNESSLLKSIENILKQDLILMGHSAEKKIANFNYHSFHQSLINLLSKKDLEQSCIG